jgi:hypothetical protein
MKHLLNKLLKNSLLLLSRKRNTENNKHLFMNQNLQELKSSNAKHNTVMENLLRIQNPTGMLLFFKANAKVLAMVICLMAVMAVANPALAKTTSPSISTSLVSDTATAVFTSKNSLVLDTKTPLVTNYVADIKVLGFTNPLEVDIFFNKITDNLLFYKVDYKNNKVVIGLRLAYGNSAWTVADWNKYIHDKLNQ